MDEEEICLSSVSGSGEKHHSGDEDAALKSVFERKMPATGQPFIIIFRSFVFTYFSFKTALPYQVKSTVVVSRCKQVQFKEVFQFKEEFHCSQNEMIS